MSWGHLIAVRGLAPDAPAQAVLSELAAYANEADKSWPSQQTIAQNTRLSRSTVQLALARLIAAKLVKLIQPGARTWQPAIYLVCVPSSPTAVLASQPVQTELAREAVEPVQTSPTNGQTSPTDPSNWPDSRAPTSGESSDIRRARPHVNGGAPPRSLNGPEGARRELLAIRDRLRQDQTPESTPPVVSGTAPAELDPTRAEIIARRRREAEQLAAQLAARSDNSRK